jgi:hypothetical protein
MSARTVHGRMVYGKKLESLSTVAVARLVVLLRLMGFHSFLGFASHQFGGNSTTTVSGVFLFHSLSNLNSMDLLGRAKANAALMSSTVRTLVPFTETIRSPPINPVWANGEWHSQAPTMGAASRSPIIPRPRLISGGRGGNSRAVRPLGVGCRPLSATPIRNSANNVMSDFIGS